jgi:hypothetical protein
MHLKIVNCPDKDFKPYVERAALFYAKELISNTRVRNNCYTIINFTNKIDALGYANVEEYNSKKQPREFLIELHSGIGARKILEALAHEMVHVKQYIEGETDDQLSVWRGKKINSDKLDYWIHPWEIDAYGREVGLVNKFAVSEHLWEVFEEFRNPSLPIESLPIMWKQI